MPEPTTPALSGDQPGSAPAATPPTEPTAPATTPEKRRPDRAAPVSGTARRETPTAVPPKPAEPTAPDWQKVLETVPDDELAAHPKLQGRIGTIAQKQAERLAQQRAQQLAQEIISQRDAVANAEWARTEEERLLRDDPIKASETRLAQLERAKVLAEHEEAVYAPVRQFFFDLEPEVKDALAGKTYAGTGTPAEQQVAFLKDAFDASLKVAVEKEVGKRTSEIKAAARKELLAEQGLAEPSTDQGGASAPATLTFKATDIAKMSPREYTKHREEILASLRQAS